MSDADRSPAQTRRAPRAAMLLHSLAAALYILMALGHTIGHLAAEPDPAGDKAQMYGLMRTVTLDLPGGFTSTMQGLFDFASESLAILWAFVGLLNLAAAPALARDATILSRVTFVNFVAALGLLALCVRTPVPPLFFYVVLVALNLGTMVIVATRRR